MRVIGFWLVVLGCGGADPIVYDACEVAGDCTALPDGVSAVCIPKSDEGFCTWSCADDDACAVGDVEWPLVCSPFESQLDQSCFPACDGDACPDGFTCRSTGGGAANRRVCFPS